MNWIGKQIEWMKSFLSEQDGTGSSRRGMSILVVLTFLFSYLKTSLATQTIQDIPSNWAFTIGAIIGFGVWSTVAKKSADPNAKQ